MRLWPHCMLSIVPVFPFALAAGSSQSSHSLPGMSERSPESGYRDVVMNAQPIKLGKLMHPKRTRNFKSITIRGGSLSASASSSRLQSSSQSSEALTSNTLSDDGSSVVLHDAIRYVGKNGHAMALAEVLRYMAVCDTSGLSSARAAVRRRIFGPNSLAPPPARSFFSLVLEQFEDRLVQILLGVAVLSAFLAAFESDAHAFTEPAVIMSILIINAVVGIWQSRSAEDSLDALKKLQPETTSVLRDGQWLYDFPAGELVPGDVIHLRVGDKVPADARIISLKTATLSTDEGSLTGESTTVSKIIEPVSADSTISGKVNMLFSGTMVTNGACYAVVTGTGTSTEIGEINSGVQAAKLHAINAKTPLGEQLEAFGDQLTLAIGLICASVWLCSVPKFSSAAFGGGGGWHQGALYHAKTAVALGVAAIPEGLPAVITLCLSLGTRRMAEKNVIVRRLPSVETLGCTSVICTDKTGTLTTNQMTVKSLVSFSLAADADSKGGVANGNSARIIRILERSVDGVSYEPLGKIQNFDEREMAKKGWRDIAAISSINNEAKVEFRDGAYTRIGEPTEAALRVMVEKLGVAGLTKDYEPKSLASQCNSHWERAFEKLAVLEFSRDRKSMGTLCRPKAAALDGFVVAGSESGSRSGSGSGSGSGSRSGSGSGSGSATTMTVENCLFVKGAAELVLSRCSMVQCEDGTLREIDGPTREELKALIRDMSKRPLRCLALAFKEGKDLPRELREIDSAERASSSEILRNVSGYISIEDRMTLAGFCGIKDPARPEAAEAILRCRQAGVRVMMMTGDSKETAIAIARDVNIFTDGDALTFGEGNESLFFSNSAFTGQEFFSLSEERQLELLRHGNKVFCRTEPRDKQRLIGMLEKLGEIPAMTGDGVNDAPALQQAAIGIAMGITGTEVAKNAADMVLADDNFASIVAAVEEGRAIFSNMQTFICFLISTNIGELLTMFLSTILGIPEPLTPLHLLWVNLVTDGPPATALGFNPPDPDAMSKPPRPRNAPILSRWLMIRYLITGAYVGFATIGVFVHWYFKMGVTYKQLSNWGECMTWSDFSPKISNCNIFTTMRRVPQSLSLSVLVVIEMLKALSAISLNNSMLAMPPWKNKWLLLGVTIPSILHLMVLYIPPFASIFGVSPLSLSDWGTVLLFALPILLIEELLKLAGRRIERDEIAHSIRSKQTKTF